MSAKDEDVSNAEPRSPSKDAAQHAGTLHVASSSSTNDDASSSVHVAALPSRPEAPEASLTPASPSAREQVPDSSKAAESAPAETPNSVPAALPVPQETRGPSLETPQQARPLETENKDEHARASVKHKEDDLTLNGQVGPPIDPADNPTRSLQMQSGEKRVGSKLLKCEAANSSAALRERPFSSELKVPVRQLSKDVDPNQLGSRSMPLSNYSRSRKSYNMSQRNGLVARRSTRKSGRHLADVPHSVSQQNILSGTRVDNTFGPAGGKISIGRRTTTLGRGPCQQNIPLVNDQDAYTVKETVITLMCEDIEVPCKTLWPLSSIEELRDLCQANFEFLQEYENYDLSCHHRRPYGADSNEATEIVIEISAERALGSTVTFELVSFFSADQLIAMFQASVREMKLGVFKVCLLEMGRRFAGFDQEDVVKQQYMESEEVRQASAARNARGAALIALAAAAGEAMETPPGVCDEDTKKPLLDLCAHKWEEDRQKLVDCMKSMFGELRNAPECIFIHVLQTLYVLIDNFVDDEEHGNAEESDEYFTFVLRGFAVPESSPFFADIFMVTCDMFMLLYSRDADASCVMDGPAFDVIMHQTRNPKNGSFEVATSAAESLVALFYMPHGDKKIPEDVPVWRDWIIETLTKLFETEDFAEGDWCFPAALSSMYRMWNMFAHRSSESQNFFKQHADLLRDSIIKFVMNPNFDPSDGHLSDVVVHGCTAIFSTFAEGNSFVTPDGYTDKLQKCLFGLLNDQVQDPDAIDLSFRCFALINQKSMLTTMGSDIIESMLRAVSIHRGRPRFVANAFHALCLFLRSSPAMQGVLTTDGLDLIVSVIKEDPFNELLQENGMFLLAICTGQNEYNRTHLIKCGAQQLCKVAVGQFPENARLRNHAKFASGTLSKETSWFASLWN